ncbi:MAG: CpaF family protein [Anaerolineae bacterium]|nr:CpaF family protein [Anaerolineae bacterium]
MFKNRPAQNVSNNDQENTSYDSSVNLLDLMDDMYHFRDLIQTKMISDMDDSAATDNVSREEHTAKRRKIIEFHFNEIISEENRLYSQAVRAALLNLVVADILGLGPLQPYLVDPEITEVMVNGPSDVYVEKLGKIFRVDASFEDQAHLMRIIDRIVSPLGRRIDEASPMVDARLPSGYRVNATIPPLSLDGPILTIRKFAQKPFTDEDLIRINTVSEHVMEFLKACVEARVNMIISGGTGSGKTTLLNVISAYIPKDERIITIEDVAELQLNREHVVRLEKRPPNVEGQGEITIRQLVVNALRMRPDRIVVGESRSGEAIDMLQAMNTGHDGSLTTIHSNSPRDTLRRLEIMVMMAELELPLSAIREQVASSIDLIVHIKRMRDGSRKVVQISDVQRMEGQTIVMQDIFHFVLEGHVDGEVRGQLEATGLRPLFYSKFEEYGVEVPLEIFQRS